jgi:AcrR family transcriptional regulator
VSSATAYNYFSSKEHLLASLFWHKLSEMPSPPEDPAEPAAARIARVVQGFADLISAEPELEGAYRAALMAEDPDAMRVRDAIRDHLIQQFNWALGSELSRTGQEAVQMAFVGAMVLAGAGAIPFDALGERIAEIVRLLH